MKDKNYAITISNMDYTNKAAHYNKNSLTFLNDSEIERQITYNEIMVELLELGYNEYYITLRDLIRNNHNPNEFIMSIITKNSETKSTLGYRVNTIQHYLDQDLMNLFK